MIRHCQPDFGGLAATTTVTSPQSRPSRPSASCPPSVNPSSGAIQPSQPDFRGFSFPLFVNPSLGAIHCCQPDFGGLAATTTLKITCFPSHIRQPELGGDSIRSTRLRGLLNSIFVNPSSGAIPLGQPDFGGLTADDTGQEYQPYSLRV